MAMFSSSETEFYKRQIVLEEMGEEGQQRLKDSKVLVIGAGGLGSPVLTYLATAGVGHITIYDYDRVCESNLHRQTLFTLKDLEQKKAIVAQNKLKILNPYIEVIGIAKIFNQSIDIHKFDYVIDCSDSLSTKFIAHDLAFKAKKKFCMASIHKFEGQIQFFDFTLSEDLPCLRCLWPEIPDDNQIQTCEQAGVIGAVPGVLGSIQAMEIIKSIIGINHLKNNQNLIINLMDFSSMKINYNKDPNCPICGAGQLQQFPQENEISFEQAKNEKYTFINISELKLNLEDEFITDLNLTNLDITSFNQTQNIAVICNRGLSSLKVVKKLRDQGFKNTYSIIGGIKAL